MIQADERRGRIGAAAAKTGSHWDPLVEFHVRIPWRARLARDAPQGGRRAPHEIRFVRRKSRGARLQGKPDRAVP
jgi:hypothetical protein